MYTLALRLNVIVLYLGGSCYQTVPGSGVRRVSVLEGERSAEDAPFWCIIAVDILGAGTGVCPPQARSTEATRVAYL